ncbi:MAG: glycosyltransferase [Pirellulaceae bacterium]
MNNLRRVLIVARHYWPNTTDATLRLRCRVANLRRDGYSPVVVTPRWHTAWPKRIMCEETPVYRIDNPPHSQLRASRYWRNLTQWVALEMPTLDSIYCDAADSDAYALLTQLPRSGRPPISVRYDPSELSQNALGQWKPAPRCTDACRRADTLIAPTALAHQQLLSLGVLDSAIIRQPDPPGMVVDRSVTARSAARAMLAQVNHDLFVRSQDRVVVCPGELTRDWGVDFLIKSLGPLVESRRSLKLWILGDGIERPRIYDALQFAGLHRVVAMPGIFACMKPILQVADLCVLPAANRGLGWALPTCIANNIPVVAADSLELRELLGSQSSELSFPANHDGALHHWVTQWLRNSKAVERATTAARVNLVAESSRYTPVAIHLHNKAAQ